MWVLGCEDRTLSGFSRRKLRAFLEFSRIEGLSWNVSSVPHSVCFLTARLLWYIWRHEIQLPFPAWGDTQLLEGLYHQPDGLCMLGRCATRAPVSLFMNAQWPTAVPDWSHFFIQEVGTRITKLDGARALYIYSSDPHFCLQLGRSGESTGTHLE